MSAQRYYSRANLRALLQKKRIIRVPGGFKVITKESDSYQYSSDVFHELTAIADHIGNCTAGSGNSCLYARAVVNRLFKMYLVLMS